MMEQPQKTARFDFSPDLGLLLAHKFRSGCFDYTFNGPQTAKHLIEALGIPHTEISRILVNGKPGSLDHLVQDGDHLKIFSSLCNQSAALLPLDEPRFVVDGHLGRLTAYLRMLGLDCLYRSDYSDPELVKISCDEGRILLTRDRRLLMHKTILKGCLLRSLDPENQLIQVLHRYSLKDWIRPFQRCLLCNHELQVIQKEAVLDRLLPLTRKYFDEFRTCPSCGQIYWKGSHYERMLKLVEKARG